MELWDLYDKNEQRTGEVFERTHGSFFNIPEGRFHLVCDILVQHMDGTYLLTKRHPGKDVYPGYWEASAGGSALQGEDPLTCAKRELYEETGIQSENFELVNKVFRDQSHSLLYCFLTVVDCPKDSVVLQEGETVEYKWVDAQGLIEYAESDLAIRTSVERYKKIYDKVRAELAGQGGGADYGEAGADGANSRETGVDGADANAATDAGTENAAGAASPKPNVSYRKLTEVDLQEFIRIRINQLREEGATQDIDLVPALLDYYHRHMADGTFVSWLAVDGDKIVGTSGMSFVEKPPYFSCPSGKIGLLSSMYTNPNYRRLGIAKQLLSHVGEEARAFGCGCVQITASDMGVLLYTDFGFKKNGNFMQYNF